MRPVWEPTLATRQAVPNRSTVNERPFPVPVADAVVDLDGDRLILIVEDDADVREMIAWLLELEGYHTHAVTNGREALDYLQRGHRPRLILLDLMMPIMDGWGFLRESQLDPSLASVPVIVLSAIDQSCTTGTGHVTFITKPLDFDRLLDLVRHHCTDQSEPGALTQGDADPGQD